MLCSIHQSGQVTIIPKPELRWFFVGGGSLTQQVASAEVAIICPDQWPSNKKNLFGVEMPRTQFNFTMLRDVHQFFHLYISLHQRSSAAISFSLPPSPQTTLFSKLRLTCMKASLAPGVTFRMSWTAGFLVHWRCVVGLIAGVFIVGDFNPWKETGQDGVGVKNSKALKPPPVFFLGGKVG